MCSKAPLSPSGFETPCPPQWAKVGKLMWQNFFPFSKAAVIDWALLVVVCAFLVLSKFFSVFISYQEIVSSCLLLKQQMRFDVFKFLIWTRICSARPQQSKYNMSSWDVFIIIECCPVIMNNRAQPLVVPYWSEYKTAFFPRKIGPKKSGRLIFRV